MSLFGLTKANRGDSAPATAKSANGRVLSPAVDIIESADSFNLLADLPGVNEKSVEVIVERNQLTIRGSIAEEKTAGTNLAHRESRSGSYERSFVLSDEIDPKAVSANMKNGVLTLELPKTKELQPRRIEIRAD